MQCDPPLLLSHSAASTSCDSRLEEQLTSGRLQVADEDDISESSHNLLQHVRARPSLAGNKDVALQRVLCPYHQLVATNSANVADPTAFVAFRDATLQRMPENDVYFRAGEHAADAGVCQHEIDLIRDSLNNTLPRNSCDRQTVEMARATADDDHADGQQWRTTARSATGATSSTQCGNLSRTVGRATNVSFTCSRQTPASVRANNDQLTC